MQVGTERLAQCTPQGLLRGVRQVGDGPQAEPQQGLAERRPLGPVEVQERVVDVEEDGAEEGQATWRGR